MEFEYDKPEVTEPAVAVEEATVEVVEPVVEAAPVVEEVAPVVEQPKKKVAKGDLVTISSTKKVAWDGVGTLNVGLNTVTKEEADKWIAAKYYVTLVEETNK
jgi:hypothetical protein